MHKGIFYLVLGIIILSGLGASYFHFKNNQINRDKITLCREDGIITTDHVIVVDATDSFNETQSLLAKKGSLSESNEHQTNTSQVNGFSLNISKGASLNKRRSTAGKPFTLTLFFSKPSTVKDASFLAVINLFNCLPI